MTAAQERTLEEAAVLQNSEMARSIRNFRFSLVVLMLGVAALGVAVGITFFSTTEARRVASSPCVQEPASPECAVDRQAVAEAEPIKNPCISYQRVTSRVGRNCPGFVFDRTPGGGDASQPASNPTAGQRAEPGLPGSPAPGRGRSDQRPNRPDRPVAEPSPPAASPAPAPEPQAPPPVVSPPPKGQGQGNGTPPAKPEAPAGPKGPLSPVNEIVSPVLEGVGAGTCGISGAVPTCPRK